MTNFKKLYSKFHIVFLLFSFINCYSQSKNDTLIAIIKKADKIILASHKDLFETIQKPGKSNQIWRKIIENGKPNKKIIQEKVILDIKKTEKLIAIIRNQNPEEYFEGAFTSYPNQTIFILLNKKWEFIDICFKSHNYHFSEGININKKTFLASYNDWSKLEDFFRELNLTYKITYQKN